MKFNIKTRIYWELSGELDQSVQNDQEFQIGPLGTHIQFEVGKKGYVSKF